MKAPGKFQAIAIMQLVTGILYFSSVAMAVIGTCGLVLVYIPLIYGLLVSAFAFFNGLKGVGPHYQDGKYKLVAILQIINIIGGDIFGMIAGILTLVFLNDEDVQTYLAGDIKAEFEEL